MEVENRKALTALTRGRAGLRQSVWRPRPAFSRA